MYQGLIIFAVFLTLIVSFNNPRAIFWLVLGSVNVLICSAYDHFGFRYVMGWAPSAVFVSMIGMAVFCQIIDNVKIFCWEYGIYRLGCFSMVFMAAKFLDVPVISELNGPLLLGLLGLSIAIIFSNSLLKSGLMSAQHNAKLNKYLKFVGCNSDIIRSKEKWWLRWL